MIDAIHQAVMDTGSSKALEKLTSLRVVQGSWPYQNPAKYLYESLDLEKKETGRTAWGGNGVQSAIARSALEIAARSHKLIVIVGAECGRTQAKARRQGLSLSWKQLPGEPDWTLEGQIGMRHEVEAKLGIGQAIHVYPLLENALRYHRNETLEQHINRVSELWSRFSKVASENPHAWIRDHKTAEEIRTVTPNNRHVSFPYPKMMNANNNVDQAAAIMLCSEETASELGIDRSKWIYPWTTAEAHDTYHLSYRPNYHSAPGLRTAARKCLELAQLQPNELDHVDLYSCFPSVVQIACKEIGLREEQPLTVTGGLTFAGGPLNNYVSHAIVRMVEILREDSSKKGLISATGGITTKHALGVYSGTDPEHGFQYANVQEHVPQDENLEVDATPSGDVTIETYSVMYRGDDPVRGSIACLTPSGKRCWGISSDQGLLQDMVQNEYCGTTARIDSDANLTPAM